MPADPALERSLFDTAETARLRDENRRLRAALVAARRWLEGHRWGGTQDILRQVDAALGREDVR